MGLDEAYADLTGVPKPLRVLRELVDEVREATGITISVGVGPSRLVAKCCSDHGKPAGLVAMGREEACERFAVRADQPRARDRPQDRRAAGRAGPAHDRPAPARRRGAARRPLRRAHRRGFLKARAEFHDDSPVETERGAAKSRSSETTFDTDIADLAELEAVLRRLSAELCEGLATRGRRGRTIAIKVRLNDWTTVTRARSVEAPTNDAGARHRGRARAAARLRAAEAGAAARRAAGVLRGRRRAAAPAGRRRVGRASSAAGRPRRSVQRGGELAARLARDAGARRRARRARRRRSGAGRRAGRRPCVGGDRGDQRVEAALELAGVERRERAAQRLVVLEPQPRGEARRRRTSRARRPSSSSASSRSPRAASSRASGTAASARPGSSSSARRRSSSPPAATSASASEGSERVEEALDLRGRLRADELGDDLAVAERLHRRDALDPERGRDARVGVGVDLGQRDLAVARGHGLLEHRRERAARAAPRGPEVDDDGQLARALDDVALEGLRR